MMVDTLGFGANVFVGVVFSTLLGITHGKIVVSPDTNQSRHNRYVAFPDGSSFSVVICLTIGQIGNPELDYMSYAINWGIAYDLPNETWIAHHVDKLKTKDIYNRAEVIQRRHKRNLYREMEIVLDSMGYGGKDCIMRALCEARKYLHRRTSTMEIELLKTIFRLPMAEVSAYEHQDVYHYDEAYRWAHDTEDCSKAYENCGFSLLALGFGRYMNQLYKFM